MKKIAIGLAVLIVLAGAALFFLHANLDSIIKAAIEKYGTQAAQTDVRVSGVKISLTSGEGSLGGLSIANPKGFSSAKALESELISIKLDTASVSGTGPIIINEIVIDKPQVQFEATETGDSNLQAIYRNADSLYAREKMAEKSPQKQASGRKVIIKDFYIRNAHITISHPALDGHGLTTSLGLVHMSDIGKDKGGVSFNQAAALMLKTITDSTKNAAANDLAKNLGSAVKDITGSGPDKVINRVGGLLR